MATNNNNGNNGSMNDESTAGFTLDEMIKSPDINGDEIGIDVDEALTESLTLEPGRVKYIHATPGSTNVAPPLDGDSIIVNVRSTFIDRLAGTVVTEPIWRDVVNISTLMKRAGSAEVRSACAKFFLGYKAAIVIKPLIPTHTIQVGNAFILPNELFNGIVKVESNASAQMVIMELLASYLQVSGVMARNGNYTTRAYYPFETVTTEKLASDIAMQEVARTLGKVAETKIADRKYTAASFADAVAENMYMLGKAFLEVNDMGGVIDDIVKGVRKYLDPDMRGLEGNIDTAWANSEVVKEFAQNYVFIRAALSIPAKTQMLLTNEAWKLSQSAPVILAALKTSTRYATVGKNEVLRNIGLRKVRNLRQQPVSYVMWRSAKPEAVAQSVFAFNDVRTTGAVTVTHTKERIAEAVVSAYGNTTGLGTDTAARDLHQFLTAAIEAGYTGYKMGYNIELGNYNSVSDHEVACLISDSVRLDVGYDAELSAPSLSESSSSANSRWWFKVQTKEREFPFIYSGKMLDATTIITNNIGEVYLAMDEFEPASPVEPRPQLIAPLAFDSRIMGFDTEKDLVKLGTRYSFSVKINGNDVGGSFRASDIGSLRSNSDTALVVPVFNRDVFQIVGSTYETIDVELKKMLKASTSKDGGVSSDVIGFLARQQGRNLLAYAQNLAPGFRQEIENGMKERGVRGLAPDAAYAMRAKLSQREFGGYADVNALMLFLTLQGIVIPVWVDALKQVDMVRTFLDYGTDRNAK